MIQRMAHSFSATGAGDAHWVYGCNTHTWQTIITGSPTSVTVRLEGSIDGTNWFQLDESTSLTNEMRHIAYKLATQVRANLITLSGGSTPTVTVTSVSGSVEPEIKQAGTSTIADNTNEV